MKYIEIKNWRTFQHYSDRRPPWIKLYVHLLDDLEHMALSDAEIVALMRVWLMAARFGHPLPNNPKLLLERGGVKPPVLARLIAKGWLRLVDGASADSNTDASSGDSTDDSTDDSALTRASARSREGEGEREVEGEQELSSSSPGAAPLWTTHLSGEAAAAAGAYRASHPHPEAFDRHLEKLAAPITGNGFGWAIVGQALAEMSANGALWHQGRCARYCAELKQGPVPKAPRASRNGRHREANLRVLGEFGREAAHG